MTTDFSCALDNLIYVIRCAEYRMEYIIGYDVTLFDNEA